MCVSRIDSIVLRIDSTRLLKDGLNCWRIDSIVEGWSRTRQNQIESIVIFCTELFLTESNLEWNMVQNQADFHCKMSRFHGQWTQSGANWVDFITIELIFMELILSTIELILEMHTTHFLINNFYLPYYSTLKHSLLSNGLDLNMPQEKNGKQS